MSAAQFTPGPWRLQLWKIGHRQRHRAIYAQIAPGHYPEGVLAHTMGSRPEAMNDANAALIATAPELYEWLEAALDEREQEHGSLPDGAPHWSVRARHVLAKARGEQ